MRPEPPSDQPEQPQLGTSTLSSDFAALREQEQKLRAHYYETKVRLEGQVASLGKQLDSETARATAAEDTLRDKEAAWALKLGQEKGRVEELRAQLQKKADEEDEHRRASKEFWQQQKDSENGKGADKNDEKGKGKGKENAKGKGKNDTKNAA